MKRAFTMVELIFAISIIGILSLVAAPKLLYVIDKARVAKLKDDYVQLVSAIEYLNAEFNRLPYSLRSTLSSSNPNAAPNLCASKDIKDKITAFAACSSSAVFTALPVSISSNFKFHAAATSTAGESYRYENKNIKMYFQYDSSNGKLKCGSQNTGNIKTLCEKMQKEIQGF